MAPCSSQDIPSLIYGTAFAFDKTPSLVQAALHAGFRGIDTAGALGAYREKLVGDGIRDCIDSGLINRDDIFVRWTRLSIFVGELVLTRWLDSNQVLTL